MIRILLTKIVNDKERFYLIIINKNIFNEYILERIYGNTNNSSFTGKKSNIIENIEDAIIILKDIVRLKQKKHYKINFIKYIKELGSETSARYI